MEKYSEFIDDLKTLISFKSVKGAKTKDAPFGKESKDALCFFLSVAKKMGFKTINYDNYAGEIIFGKGEEIGIIGHLDVVPEGNGWETNPYVLTFKNGVYYGRGVEDDKGPMLICLYALKALKDSKIKCNKTFRFFVGTNEESGWEDVKYLKTKTTLPEYGFSPDGDFPVVYAEKGMVELTFEIPKFKNFENVVGGTVVNAVCGKASIKPKNEVLDKQLKKYGLLLENGKIISIGKSAHGSCPKLGKNALKPLFRFLLSQKEDVKNVIDCLFNDKYKIFKIKTEQGNVTFSPDLIKEKGDKIYITCDLRIPAPLTLESLTPIFDKFKIPYTTKTRHLPQMVEKDGEFVNALLSSYNKVMKKKGKPISQNGSTFARAFSKGCAFGPEFIGVPSSIHEPNENISEKNLLFLYEIYKTALFDLAK